ncbi:MAG: cob(I)yrinic acid a,c-diamide adenosyltransferase [Deltaproteobacteria bacterium]|jgi:cob(I)alamin adenosyltransferase|nr:cob(I)yrinic acid a,c-diamide adenosyltransferase [Deltaproteobacteria bacterium]
MAKGLVLVNTGTGKGKTTAALGAVSRALGHGLRVGFIQFIKSKDTGESRFLEDLAQDKTRSLHYARHGRGFVGKNPSQTDRDLARDGLELAQALAGELDLLVLDEINVAISLGLIGSAEVAEFLKGRPPELNVILTGRGCPDDLIDLADTVTEMIEVRHAFRNGTPACRGVDF